MRCRHERSAVTEGSTYSWGPTDAVNTVGEASTERSKEASGEQPGACRSFVKRDPRGRSALSGAKKCPWGGRRPSVKKVHSHYQGSVFNDHCSVCMDHCRPRVHSVLATAACRPSDAPILQSHDPPISLPVPHGGDGFAAVLVAPEDGPNGLDVFGRFAFHHVSVCTRGPRCLDVRFLRVAG